MSDELQISNEKWLGLKYLWDFMFPEESERKNFLDPEIHNFSLGCCAA
jgi:hypothetical protein